MRGRKCDWNAAFKYYTIYLQNDDVIKRYHLISSNFEYLLRWCRCVKCRCMINQRDKHQSLQHSWNAFPSSHTVGNHFSIAFEIMFHYFSFAGNHLISEWNSILHRTKTKRNWIVYDIRNDATLNNCYDFYYMDVKINIWRKSQLRLNDFFPKIF